MIGYSISSDKTKISNRLSDIEAGQLKCNESLVWEGIIHPCQGYYKTVILSIRVAYHIVVEDLQHSPPYSLQYLYIAKNA